MEYGDKKYESVYSSKVRAGKRRTYFFDVRKTRGEDYYVTITESTKKYNGGNERHKIFLYKEDFNRFVAALQDSVNHVKNDLLPDYDFEEYERRQEEWESQQESENKSIESSSSEQAKDESEKSTDTDDDNMSW